MSNTKPVFVASPTIAILAVITAILVAPIIATLAGAFTAQGGVESLLAPRGIQYATGTLVLCGMVGIGAALLGVGAASLICMTEFPGRRLLAILLAMPFAIPAYVSAYAYGDFFGPFGPVAALIGPSALPEIRSLPGAALVLTLAVYPYVYLAIAASLSMRSGNLLEAARLLGASPARAMWSVLVGAGRPAFAGGLALALMETAADYGVADYFGIPTLSVGIFRTWYGLDDLGAATQLAGLLFFIALIFVLLEEAGRRGISADSPRANRKQRAIQLSSAHSGIAIFLCALPVMLGFVLPAGVLIAKLDFIAPVTGQRGMFHALANTAGIAVAGAALTLALAVAVSYSARRSGGPITRLLIRVSTLGYAIPGAVIAIGILGLSTHLSGLFGAGAAGGIGVLFYAYAARFITAAYNTVSAGLAQINPQMDAAAKSLGASRSRIISRIHMPQMQSALFAGAAIVAIDIMKELPATLLLRPFNFETMATRIYRLASDERLADAAPAALFLIAISAVPVLMISRATFNDPIRRRDKQRASHRETDSGSALAKSFGGFQDSEQSR